MKVRGREWLLPGAFALAGLLLGIGVYLLPGGLLIPSRPASFLMSLGIAGWLAWSYLFQRR